MKRYLITKLKICLSIAIILALLLAACTKEQAKEEAAKTGVPNTYVGCMEEATKRFDNKDFDGVVENSLKAIKLEPKSAIAYNLLGMGYRMKYVQTRSIDYKNREREAFETSVKLDPNYWVALINLGATYYYDGEPEKGIPLFKKALEINPNHPEKDDINSIINEFESSQTNK